MRLFDNSGVRLLAVVVAVFSAFISLIASITQLWLIYDMKRWNEYLMIVATLTVCQVFYSVGFLFLPFYNIYICQFIFFFLFLFGGITVSLWTNVISVLVYQIVKNLRSVDIKPYYAYLVAGITIPSIVFPLIALACYASGVHERFYRLFELFVFMITNLSIIFNIVVYSMISWKVRKMAYASETEPVIVLSSRLKYYPLIEISARIAMIWYISAFGFDGLSDSVHGIYQTVVLMLFSLITPLEGALYFVVFLVMRPIAYQHLVRKLTRLYFWCTCKSPSSSRRRRKGTRHGQSRDETYSTDDDDDQSHSTLGPLPQQSTLDGSRNLRDGGGGGGGKDRQISRQSGDRESVISGSYDGEYDLRSTATSRDTADFSVRGSTFSDTRGSAMGGRGSVVPPAASTAAAAAAAVRGLRQGTDQRKSESDVPSNGHSTGRSKTSVVDGASAAAGAEAHGATSGGADITAAGLKGSGKEVKGGDGTGTAGTPSSIASSPSHHHGQSGKPLGMQSSSRSISIDSEAQHSSNRADSKEHSKKSQLLSRLLGALTPPYTRSRAPSVCSENYFLDDDELAERMDRDYHSSSTFLHGPDSQIIRESELIPTAVMLQQQQQSSISAPNSLRSSNAVPYTIQQDNPIRRNEPPV